MSARQGRSIVAAALTACVVTALVGSATAFSTPIGPPSNSAIDRAVRISHFPFTATTSTALAPAATNNAFCAGNSHVVWYVFTARTNTALDADTLGSDYDTTLSAWTGPPSQLTQLACNDDGNALGQRSEIQFDVKAGQTVYLMVSSFLDSPGGNLHLSVASLVNRPRAGHCGHADQPARNRCAGETNYYLALGDSAAIYDGSRSYPNLINNSAVTRRVPNLKLVKLACSLETTETFINASHCGGSQLQKAEDFLTTNQGHVALLTIDIGGNDAATCANPATGVDWNCAARVLNTTIPSNMRVILSGLRHAGGADLPMYGMNYYNPFLIFRLLGPAVYPLVDQTVFGQHLLNQRLEQLYGEFGMPTANVRDAFHSTDLSTLVPSPWGTIPLAVERACRLLAVDCTPGQVRIIDTDPNVAGGAVIARAFERTIRRLERPARRSL
jgi:hypothetical protein